MRLVLRKVVCVVRQEVQLHCMPQWVYSPHVGGIQRHLRITLIHMCLDSMYQAGHRPRMSASRCYEQLASAVAYRYRYG